MNLLNQSIQAAGLGIIATLSLVACNQPATQADIPNNSAPTVTTTPTNSTPGSANSPNVQTISVDDAAGRVDDVLDNHSTLRVFDLDADDEGDLIVLEGRVQNESQRTLAETVAQETAPGFTVENRITF